MKSASDPTVLFAQQNTSSMRVTMRPWARNLHAASCASKASRNSTLLPAAAPLLLLLLLLSQAECLAACQVCAQVVSHVVHGLHLQQLGQHLQQLLVLHVVNERADGHSVGGLEDAS